MFVIAALFLDVVCVCYQACTISSVLSVACACIQTLYKEIIIPTCMCRGMLKLSITDISTLFMKWNYDYFKDSINVGHTVALIA